jgi:hypothetical protein
MLLLEIKWDPFHHCSVRTTLSLVRMSFRDVKAYAKSENLTAGKAASELVRRRLRAQLRTRVVNGFHIVDLPPGSPPVSSKDVRKLTESSE